MADPLVVASVYIGYFLPRTDAFSGYVPNVGWRPVLHEITPEDVVGGLTGKGQSLSGYFPAADSTSHVWAIDLDTDEGLAQALKLGTTMWADGIPNYAEASRRGAHLWGLIDHAIDAKPIRRFLRAYIEKAKIPKVYDQEQKFWVDNPKIELRPATDHIHDGGLGNALRLPTMPHPATGKRYALLQSTTGKPVDGSGLGEILLNLAFADSQAIIAASAAFVPEINPHTIDRRWSEPKAHSHDEFDDMSASEILRNQWGIANAVPGKAVRCTAHDDRIASLSILRDDRRVICRGGGCILNNDGHGRGTYELITLAPQPVGA